MVRHGLQAVMFGAVALSPLHFVEAAEMALYDATYTVVAGTGDGSTQAAGEIRQSLGRECREWIYVQNADFTMPDRNPMIWETITRESVDATQFHFDMTTRNDGEVDRLQGTAIMNAYSGRAIFGDSDRTILRMEADTLFPTQFTSALIERAEAGDRFFSVPMFSGIDGHRVLRVTAVIGDPFDAPLAGTTASLLAHRGWPVTLAYFDSGDEGGIEYQIDVDLLDNGIARSLQIQGDDYRLSLELAEISALQPDDCQS